MSAVAFSECLCRRMANTQAVCRNDYTLSESGKSVSLVPRQGEQVTAYALDGCVFNDNQPKCDGLFIFQKANRRAAFLVELKGAHHIAHAFAQLAFVRQSRPEYRQILTSYFGSVMPLERAFVVSNGLLTKHEHEQLEDAYGIRVSAVLHSEPTTPVPDLRRYL